MPEYKWSPSVGTFYDTALPYAELPEDLIDVSAEEFQKAINRPASASFVVDEEGLVTIVPFVAPPPTLEDFTRLVGNEVDAILDGLAQSWRYRDYVSARSYRGDSNPQYAAEAEAISAFGSACWSILDELEAGIRSGQTPVPASVQEVLAMLPSVPARPTV